MEVEKVEEAGKNNQVNCQVRRSKKARKISLKISGGEVILVVPERESLRRALDFAKTQKDWIAQRLKESQGQQRLLQRGTREDYLKLKEQARQIARERLEHFNRHYGFQWERIAIRDQKSRWGSCSSQNNLNFNYRLAWLPANLRDYLVVHELCHLKEMNHSPRFWALVGETIPNAKRVSRELRKM